MATDLSDTGTTADEVATGGALVGQRSGARLGRRRGKEPYRKLTAGDIASYVLLTLLSFFILFPVWMTLVRALSNPSKSILQASPSLRPTDVQWGAFGQAFTEGNLGRPLLYSLGLAIVIVLGQTITSVLAAYAFAFLDFPFKKVLFGMVVATLLLPIEVTLLTNLRTFQNLGWVSPNQSFGGATGALVLPFLATAVGVFLIRQGFMGIPKDLRDAASLDGYGHLRFLWRVAIPVTRPIVASFLLISFLTTYNQYVWPRQALQDARYNTIQLTLRAVAGQRLDQLNLTFASALIASVPVLILLIAFQRQLIRGLTAGAVKG
jgi:sn-glycerol 3-phosphate transport system permease protein